MNIPNENKSNENNRRIIDPGLNAEESGSKNYKAYTKLRAMTDSVEALSILYYSKARSVDDRKYRSEQIEALLAPVIRQIAALMNHEMNADCPEPLKPCGNCCLPYDCSVLDNI